MKERGEIIARRADICEKLECPLLQVIGKKYICDAKIIMDSAHPALAGARWMRMRREYAVQIPNRCPKQYFDPIHPRSKSRKKR